MKTCNWALFVKHTQARYKEFVGEDQKAESVQVKDSNHTDNISHCTEMQTLKSLPFDFNTKPQQRGLSCDKTLLCTKLFHIL